MPTKWFFNVTLAPYSMTKGTMPFFFWSSNKDVKKKNTWAKIVFILYI